MHKDMESRRKNGQYENLAEALVHLYEGEKKHE